MIPPREQIEHLYTARENELLDKIRDTVNEVANLEKRNELGRAMLRKIWREERQFIENTHWIETKEPGVIALLRFNYVQEKLYALICEMRAAGLPIRVIALKARQMGCSTFIASLFYEFCDREPHRKTLVISYDDPSAEELFRKPTFIHEHLWFARTRGRDRSMLIDLLGDYDARTRKQTPWSSFFAKTAGNIHAGRSQTFHYAHFSEVPMWTDADETLNSATQSIPNAPNTAIIWESTARGAVGPFYTEWTKARRGEGGTAPFFAPWFWDPSYRLPFRSEDHRNRFGRTLTTTELRLLERFAKDGVDLERLNWRRAAIESNCQGSARKFQQEYPSTAEEAFLTTGASVFDAESVARLEHHASLFQPEFVGEITLQRVSE